MLLTIWLQNCPKTLSRERCKQGQFLNQVQDVTLTYDSNSRRLTILKETAHLQNDSVQLLESYTTCSLSHWIIVFTQVFVSCDSLQYKWCVFTFLFNGSCINYRNFHMHWMCNWKMGPLDRACQKISSSVDVYFFLFAKDTAIALWRGFWASGITTHDVIEKLI